MGNKALRVNWDPANALNAGDTPFPLGYGYVKNYIANVHVKDVRLDPSTGKWRYVEAGEGDVNWRGQLKALEADGFRGCCAIETHFGPKIRRSRDCLNGLRKILRELRIEHN